MRGRWRGGAIPSAAIRDPTDAKCSLNESAGTRMSSSPEPKPFGDCTAKHLRRFQKACLSEKESQRKSRLARISWLFNVLRRRRYSWRLSGALPRCQVRRASSRSSIADVSSGLSHSHGHAYWRRLTVTTRQCSSESQTAMKAATF